MTESNMAPGAEHDHRSGCDDEEQVECPDCDGKGKLNKSVCCDALIKWADIAARKFICEKCSGHCDKVECETCEGTGEIDLRQFKAIKAEEKEDSQANE